MTITIDATFENGQLKFKQPVALAEGTPVRVTITPVGEMPVDKEYDPLDAVIGICTGGPRDGAANHDTYIYGPKPTKSPKAVKKSTKNRK